MFQVIDFHVGTMSIVFLTNKKEADFFMIFDEWVYNSDLI